MGFFSNLFSVTGTGKYAAAVNAVIAKEMFDPLTIDQKIPIQCAMIEELITGGIPRDEVSKFLYRMDIGAYFGMTAMTYMKMGISPSMPTMFPRGQWNYINNPLVALSDANDQIQVVINTLKTKYRINAKFNAHEKAFPDD